ncbi:hypothetical protein GCM10009759_31140 [Kitasatospora saccharophila]|uniref:Probable transposase IS891/IS1136/IS1341 domain-containing protein n=1 Tax=Kitasatospora saccharophila TaxID=407973 RepID=A0ABN2WWF8_9ACTN
MWAGVDRSGCCGVLSWAGGYGAAVQLRYSFRGLKGERSRMGAPRFKSRKDTRQAVRFTANARWSITPGGKLSLPKVGDLAVKWSRTLPSVPATVTLVKDSAGRYFASFVVETDPAADLARMPDTDTVVGIDLGLAHFAVLSDGTKTDSPRFLRRAEKKLKRAQQALARKAKGSKNWAKARIRVARAHARVADARREFHHQLSTKIIRDNQAVAVEDLAVSACGARIRRAPVPAPRSEAGTHPKRPTPPVREQAGIPGPQAGEDVNGSGSPSGWGGNRPFPARGPADW